jgi:predicted nucleic acid-binding protein
MRVLVDTSAWVDFFNDFDSPEADALASLIREEADILTCGVVVAEVLQGLKQTKTLGAIERHFLEMEWLTPSEPKTSIEVANLYRKTSLPRGDHPLDHRLPDCPASPTSTAFCCYPRTATSG